MVPHLFECLNNFRCQHLRHAHPLKRIIQGEVARQQRQGLLDVDLGPLLDELQGGFPFAHLLPVNRQEELNKDFLLVGEEVTIAPKQTFSLDVQLLEIWLIRILIDFFLLLKIRLKLGGRDVVTSHQVELLSDG